MIGAIIGDIVGSPYEFDNIKTKDFPLFSKISIFTDDTVMTIAVGKALSQYDRKNSLNSFKNNLIDIMHDIGNKYPDCGFGGRFEDWILDYSRIPYNSCGNGSAMRVSPVAWFANSIEECEELAKASAEITHNHPDGIKGAQAVAVAIYLAKIGKTKEEIKEYVENKYYKISFTLDEIRPTYEFVPVNNGTVQPALEAFFESTNFEDAIRNAISIGGDSDTVAAITGSVAEAYYGIDQDLKETALSFLDNDLLDDVEIILAKMKEWR